MPSTALITGILLFQGQNSRVVLKICIPQECWVVLKICCVSEVIICSCIANYLLSFELLACPTLHLVHPIQIPKSIIFL